MNMTYEGQLEIRDDGVVYFHSAVTGTTIMRIGGLPAPVPFPTVKEVSAMVGRIPEALDIHVGQDCKVNWPVEGSK
jgi:hypothetical protein